MFKLRLFFSYDRKNYAERFLKLFANGNVFEDIFLYLLDTEFYNTCEKILCFVNNAENMFLNGNVEDKRFITKLLLSNSSYYNGKLDCNLVYRTIFN